MNIDFDRLLKTVQEQKSLKRGADGYIRKRIGMDSASQWTGIKRGERALPEKYEPAMRELLRELGLVNGVEHEPDALAAGDAVSEPEPEHEAEHESKPEPKPESNPAPEPEPEPEPEPTPQPAAEVVDFTARRRLAVVESGGDAQEVSLDALVAQGKGWVQTHYEEQNGELSYDALSDLFRDLLEQGADKVVASRVCRAVKELWPDEDLRALHSLWRDEEASLVGDAAALGDRSLASLLQKLNVPDVQPAEDPVDGLALAAELEAAFRRHIAATDNDFVVLTLWSFHTYLLAQGCFRVTPRLAITSPGPNCGKSVTAELVTYASYRGWTTSDVSNAGFYRVSDATGAMVAIDERDRSKGARRDLDTLLNDSWSRSSRGGIVRSEHGDTDQGGVEVFRAFVPIALAGIDGVGSDTLHSRCVEVRLHKQTADEPTVPLDARSLEQLAEAVPSRALRWAQDNKERVDDAPRLEGVPGLSNRAQDNWTVLYNVAHALGGTWPERVRACAEASVERIPGDQLTALDLALDIVRIAEDAARRLDCPWHTLSFSTAGLTTALLALDDGQWGELGDGSKKLTRRRLAQMLKPFRIAPKRVENPTPLGGAPSVARREPDRPDPTKRTKRKPVRGAQAALRNRARGYAMSDFVEVRRRYIDEADILPL